MRIALRVLVMLATICFVARSADAHMIVIRDGGTSTNLCGVGGGLDSHWFEDWVSLEPEPTEGTSGDVDGDAAGEESINNNCGDNIFSLDIQLSDDGESMSHPPNEVEAGGIFDRVQSVETEFGNAWRLFSSEGNSIECDTCFIELLQFQILQQFTIGPEFIFDVDEYAAFPFGFFKIVGFGTEQVQAVPEPASLLLLGAGLGGMALRRRRRV